MADINSLVLGSHIVSPSLFTANTLHSNGPRINQPISIGVQGNVGVVEGNLVGTSSTNFSLVTKEDYDKLYESYQELLLRVEDLTLKVEELLEERGE